MELIFRNCPGPVIKNLASFVSQEFFNAIYFFVECLSVIGSVSAEFTAPVAAR